MSATGNGPWCANPKVAKFMGDTVETVQKIYEPLAPDYLDDVHE